MKSQAHSVFLRRFLLVVEEKKLFPAVETEQEILTYQNLNLKADRLAFHLTSRGITKGSCVGIFLPPSLCFATALVALLKLGISSVFLPLDLSVLTMKRLIRETSARFILTHAELQYVIPLPMGFQSCALDELDLSEVNTDSARIILSQPKIVFKFVDSLQKIHRLSEKNMLQLVQYRINKAADIEPFYENIDLLSPDISEFDQALHFYSHLLSGRKLQIIRPHFVQNNPTSGSQFHRSNALT